MYTSNVSMCGSVAKVYYQKKLKQLSYLYTLSTVNIQYILTYIHTITTKPQIFPPLRLCLYLSISISGVYMCTIYMLWVEIYFFLNPDFVFFLNSKNHSHLSSSQYAADQDKQQCTSTTKTSLRLPVFSINRRMSSR